MRVLLSEYQIGIRKDCLPGHCLTSARTRNEIQPIAPSERHNQREDLLQECTGNSGCHCGTGHSSHSHSSVRPYAVTSLFGSASPDNWLSSCVVRPAPPARP